MGPRYIRKGKPYSQIRKESTCPACSGSGHYDVKGSPKCSECNGSGQRVR